MLTMRKWFRAFIVAIAVYILVRICLRMREKNVKGGLNSDLEFAAVVREKSGFKQRVPPDSNHTDQHVHVDHPAMINHKVTHNNESINANDTWRSRKFVDPRGAFNQKDDDPADDPTVESSKWNDATNQTSVQFKELRTLIDEEWATSRDALVQFRKQLEKAKAGIADVILTKNNTRVGQQVRYSLNRDFFVNVTNEMVDLLPQKSLFENVQLSHCSVVGNGGILLHSKCGDDIDKADFIFRCNVPIISGYEPDTGRRSNFTTINVVSTLKTRYHFMQTKVDSARFVRDAHKFTGYLWMPAFQLRHGLSYNLRVAREVHRNRELADLQLIIGNPDHFSAVQDYWNTTVSGSRISTGMYLVTLALSMCDETHLYGFWPFDVDLNLRPTKYHYYDNIGGPTSVHSFASEFRILMDMHRDGILKLHVDQCT